MLSKLLSYLRGRSGRNAETNQTDVQQNGESVKFMPCPGCEESMQYDKTVDAPRCGPWDAVDDGSD